MKEKLTILGNDKHQRKIINLNYNWQYVFLGPIYYWKMKEAATARFIFYCEFFTLFFSLTGRNYKDMEHFVLTLCFVFIVRLFAAKGSVAKI